MSDSPRYFLLSIAINEYLCDDIPNLNGCLNDAAAIESCLAKIFGPTPTTAILSLRNASATRSAILASFESHLIENPAIHKNDPIIIYYAGHGGQAEAPRGWASPSGTIETICPSDEATVAFGRLVPGIPDVTINALLRTLAHEKGNNITFICDSCHSGGINRDIAGATRPRTRGWSSVPLPLDIDHYLRERAKDESVTFGFRGNHTSHILLAACGEGETADEGLQGNHFGLFTAALTKQLLLLGPDFEYTSYSALINSLQLTSQHPQCDGDLADRYLFSRRTNFTPCFFRVTTDESGELRVAAGEVHGVVPGTEMKVYRDSAGRTDIDLAVFVCHNVGSVSSTLRTTTGRNVTQMPTHLWAAVHRWNIGPLKIHAQASIECTESTSEYPLTFVSLHSHRHLTLRSNGPGYPIVIDRLGGDHLIAEYAGQYRTEIPQNFSLPAVLSKIAHFHYHLGRQTSPEILPDSVRVSQLAKLHLYRMLPPRYLTSDKKNLLKRNIAHIDISEIQSARYTIEISNDSPWGLYVYLFSFDPSNYSIEALHMPPLGVTSPCVRANHSFVVGYGDSNPFRLQTHSHDAPDAAFFKLFVCTENVNMRHILQRSPFEISETSTPTVHSDGQIPRARIDQRPPSSGFWDVSLAVVTISKLSFRKKFIHRWT
ncbi:caspase domain-containing protein [Mycena rosella]|uniref:Caspase domain-containing protein n=1 Tax=Mycena rosella TaxID=1033263 RepID=A0AAD7BQN7_MYCRO|nr:caspase domain-containing protein [Mycena rosella]